MNLGVVGSRDFKDYNLLSQVLDATLSNFNITKIVSGGADGADSFSEKYAKEHDIEIEVFLPQWEKYGKKAGMIRNQTIIDNSDILIAFWDGKSLGTKDSINKAKKKKIKNYIIYTKTRVVHCEVEKYDVYIGRPTFWGNPWSHKDNTKALFKTETRIEAVENYRKWILREDFKDILQEKRQQILDNLETLRGKIIACWCKPKECHGDVLIELLERNENG